MQKRVVEKFSDTPTPHVAPVTRDDEISLVDLWLIIRKRWVWVLAGLLLGVAAAIAYATLTTPIYESRASINIGKVHDFGLIENPDILAARLLAQHGSEPGNGTQQRTPHLKQVTKQDNILRLVAVGHTPQEVTEFLSQIVANLLERHEQIYMNAVDPLRRRLTTVDRQVGLLTAQIAGFGELIARLKESQPVQATLIAIERSHLYARVDQLERDRVALQQKATRPSSSPSEVVVRAALPRSPAAPKKAMALVIGIVVGLLLGIISAFGAEFFSRVEVASRSAPRST